MAYFNLLVCVLAMLCASLVLQAVADPVAEADPKADPSCGYYGLTWKCGHWRRGK